MLYSNLKYLLSRNKIIIDSPPGIYFISDTLKRSNYNAYDERVEGGERGHESGRGRERERERERERGRERERERERE